MVGYKLYDVGNVILFLLSTCCKIDVENKFYCYRRLCSFIIFSSSTLFYFHDLLVVKYMFLFSTFSWVLSICQSHINNGVIKPSIG